MVSFRAEWLGNNLIFDLLCSNLVGWAVDVVTRRQQLAEEVAVGVGLYLQWPCKVLVADRRRMHGQIDFVQIAGMSSFAA